MRTKAAITPSVTNATVVRESDTSNQFLSMMYSTICPTPVNRTSYYLSKKRYGSHDRDQLAHQAFQHGAARLAVRGLAVPTLAPGWSNRQLHRRAYYPRRRA